ncbi:MFS transporter [Cordyceps fumosorosea ARSEF 2679]|uniref:MFS transporter n=1 Tax=Cordyceps fumosorosea (strain ARSEF 2679) TaxID=1081104 RepID=A0A167HIX4_CORFA|nr:MFS transporter [Cordyceps fumosorosea ARSEF 2679]OAA47964.1 MFS transporter [Cordyceps fumosorosea ARSEF 2679]
MATVFISKSGKSATSSSTVSLSDIPELGAPINERQSIFQRRTKVDKEAIATQQSVFDDPSTLEKYYPKQTWENYHRFDPLFRWTWGEESKLVWKLDLRIMVWACIMFMALELDRANILQALTDNFLNDLHLTTDDYNLGTTVFRLSFLCAELPSQLVSKWLGPDRWIPLQICLWSLVAGGQFFLSGRSSFLATRALIGILQGGFIPDIIIYLSYFYKHAELTIRLGFFWTALNLADILSAAFAIGLLNMRGLAGRAGWRWLFLIEALLTLVIGVLSWLLMPPGPCQTASWFRGKSGWFSEKEEKIIVNRVLRDDPSKSDMHNREPVTPRQLWKSLKDYDLWPIYALGLVFMIPMNPQGMYLTISLRGLGFSRSQSNLLTIPSTVIQCFTMLGLTYLAERVRNLSLVAMLGQVWALPFVIYVNVVDTATVNKWVMFAVITLLLGYPSSHPIQVAWTSRNSNTVRSRTVSAATYNMFVQGCSIISANVYRADDAPLYHRGNKAILGVVCMNITLYVLTKLYYVWRNKSRDDKWRAMTEEQKLQYLSNPPHQGNKRLDFRFAH